MLMVPRSGSRWDLWLTTGTWLAPHHPRQTFGCIQNIYRSCNVTGSWTKFDVLRCSQISARSPSWKMQSDNSDGSMLDVLFDEVEDRGHLLTVTRRQFQSQRDVVPSHLKDRDGIEGAALVEAPRPAAKRGQVEHGSRCSLRSGPTRHAGGARHLALGCT